MRTNMYIEKCEQGGYAIRRAGSEKASAILPTLEAAIEEAYRMYEYVAIYVEVVRDPGFSGRDRWRKL